MYYLNLLRISYRRNSMLRYIQMKNLSLLVSFIALITSAITSVLNYRHTRRLFRRSHYPDLQIVLGCSSIYPNLHPAIWIHCNGTIDAINIRSVIHFRPARTLFRWRRPTKTTRLFCYGRLKPQESITNSFDDIDFEQLLISFGLAQSVHTRYFDPLYPGYTVLEVQPFLRRLAERLLPRVSKYVDNWYPIIEKRVAEKLLPQLVRQEQDPLPLSDVSIHSLNYDIVKATQKYIYHAEKRPWPYNFTSTAMKRV